MNKYHFSLTIATIANKIFCYCRYCKAKMIFVHETNYWRLGDYGLDHFHGKTDKPRSDQDTINQVTEFIEKI